MANAPISSKRLEGKVALVTGGASGIGEASVRLFVRNGAKVVIADVQDDLGNDLARSIGSDDVVLYVHCDVTLESDVARAVDVAVSTYGKLDIMFNNAGTGGDLEPKIVDSDVDDFKNVFEVNVIGGFIGAKHAARVMIPAGKGSILFTASVAASICSGVAHGYVASKHAVVGLMKNLSAELGGHGIRVNCLSPYVVASPMMTKGMAKEKVEELAEAAGTLKGAVLEAKDVAEAALYLVSDEAKYVNGVNLVVDGGYSLVNPSLSMVWKSHSLV